MDEEEIKKGKKPKTNTITFGSQVTHTHTHTHTHTQMKERRKKGRHPRIRTRCSLVYEFSGLILPFFLCLEIKLILLKTTRMPPLHEIVFILLPIPIRISLVFCPSTVLFQCLQCKMHHTECLLSFLLTFPTGIVNTLNFKLSHSFL